VGLENAEVEVGTPVISPLEVGIDTKPWRYSRLAFSVNISGFSNNCGVRNIGKVGTIAVVAGKSSVPNVHFTILMIWKLNFSASSVHIVSFAEAEVPIVSTA
jgi:hypothetical protein